MAGKIKVQANIPQAQFLSMPQKFRGFVGGFGSSKTFSGCMAICQHFYEWPGINQGYFAPTFPHIRDIFFPTIDEVSYLMGLNVEIRENNKEVHFYSGRQYRGTVKCRSMDDPKTIVGFKIGHAMIDELDILEPKKAQLAWRKIIARMRYDVDGLKNGIDVTTTPEGFKETHRLFVEAVVDKPDLKNNYGLIQASTYDNEKNLPDDYIPSLVETYPDELISAYINGQFVNLTTGTVYRNYNRQRCNSNETIQPKEPLYVGMDFNVGHMSACIFVERKDGWHAVAELKDLFDTPDMVRVLQDRYQTKEDYHGIFVYPDASGDSRKSVDASKSDIALLEQAGFSVRTNPTNPRIKDRVMSVNKQFEVLGVKVNAKECPTIAKCLEQQAYDANGEPDKKSGHDHQNDSFGYPIAYEFPIVKPVIDMNFRFVS